MAKRIAEKVSIKLELFGPKKDREILCVEPGVARGYLWIGSDQEGCYGLVPDRQLRKLHDLIGGILEARGSVTKRKRKAA